MASSLSGIKPFYSKIVVLVLLGKKNNQSEYCTVCISIYSVLIGWYKTHTKTFYCLQGMNCQMKYCIINQCLVSETFTHTTYFNQISKKYIIYVSISTLDRVAICKLEKKVTCLINNLQFN